MGHALHLTSVSLLHPHTRPMKSYFYFVSKETSEKLVFKCLIFTTLFAQMLTNV